MMQTLFLCKKKDNNNLKLHKKNVATSEPFWNPKLMSLKPMLKLLIRIHCLPISSSAPDLAFPFPIPWSRVPRAMRILGHRSLAPHLRWVTGLEFCFSLLGFWVSSFVSQESWVLGLIFRFWNCRISEHSMKVIFQKLLMSCGFLVK